MSTRQGSSKPTKVSLGLLEKLPPAPSKAKRAVTDLKYLLRTSEGKIPRRRRPSLRFAIEVLERKVKREQAAERKRQREADCPGQTSLLEMLKEGETDAR